MAQYDPEIIQRFADRLYARTVSVIVVSTLLGGFIGLVIDPFAQQVLPNWIADRLPTATIPVMLALAGFVQGLERSFVLKMQAQTALCQVQIEKNTRREVGNPSMATSPSGPG